MPLATRHLAVPPLALDPMHRAFLAPFGDQRPEESAA